jgi:carbon starvation protein
MNTTTIVLIGSIIYIITYFTYGKYIKNRIIRGAKKKEVPSKRLYDGIDFVPANRYVLFGHHFASIAGAAPIVGPIIALAWGWLPALLWVWFGNILIGAVHDYLSLISSIRYDGHSIQWIAGRVIKERAGKIFSWFVLFVLILLIAAFAAIIGKLHVDQPSVPTVYLLTILIALFLGYLLYKRKMSFTMATLICLSLLIISIIGGYFLPITLSYTSWMIILFLYIIIASSLPVNLLLQPRDYLNAWILVINLTFAGIIMLFSFKFLNFPYVTTFSAKVVNNLNSPFWPVIPLIVACGSLSGFHALVASGTTSKQISDEGDAQFIGYGAMLVEGFLSTVVIAIVAAFSTLNINVNDKLAFASGYISAINESGGPVSVFAKGFGNAANYLFGLPTDIIVILASLWVASFALTTLDTANRLARYALVEICEPLKESNTPFYKFITNRLIASTLPAILGITLAWSGAWSMLWPSFGGANQMLASIALITAAGWVIRVQKKNAFFVLIPALLLWATVSAALIWYLCGPIVKFFTYAPFQAAILGTITIIMLVLNFILIYDFYRPEKHLLKMLENENV